jgi:hypothetical protein
MLRKIQILFGGLMRTTLARMAEIVHVDAMIAYSLLSRA